MHLREVLTACRDAWWAPLIGLFFGAVAALTLSMSQTPLYTSSTQLFVSTRDSASATDAFQGSQFSQQRVTSYAQLVAGEELARRVIDRLNLADSPSELSRRITASVALDTVLIDVGVDDTSPQRAQRIADVVGVEFTAMVAELESPDSSAPSPVRVAVTERASLPVEPTSPKTLRNLVLGSMIGLLGGLALPVVRARLDRSVRDPQEAARLAGAPVIGSILRDESLKKYHIKNRESGSRAAEDYRQLRNNLQFLNVDDPPRVIMISSAMPSEGKSTAVVNLALALADAGRRVVVVEADLRKPAATRYLGLVGGVGLTNILAGTAELDEVLQHGEGALRVIAAGPTPPNPGELLSSSQMASLISKLRDECDFVIVDSPPVLPVADSTGLAVYMDGVLLSVRHGETRKDHLREAAASLDRVGARTLGVIMNIVPAKANSAGSYSYDYG